MAGVDFRELFVPTMPLLEIFLRGTIMYLGLFLLLRIILKRETGSLNISDLLMVVLLSEAASNGIGGNYKSVTDGLLLVLVIIFWNLVLDWAGYRFPHLTRLLNPPPLKLVENGQMLLRNMRKEFITEEELKSALRENGLEEITEVHVAYMESDGRISVIPKEDK